MRMIKLTYVLSSDQWANLVLELMHLEQEPKAWDIIPAVFNMAPIKTFSSGAYLPITQSTNIHLLSTSVD